MTRFLSKSKRIDFHLGCIICGLFLILFSLVMVLYIIPVWCSPGSGLATTKWNSQTLPYIVSVINLILGLSISITHLFAFIKQKQEPKENVRTVSFSMIAVVVIVIAVLYVALFSSVGYIPTTVVVMILLYYIYGGKRWWEALILATVFTSIMVLFFYGYLRLAMPLIWFM